MKVAARFPVKSFYPLLIAILLLHLLLCYLSFVKFALAWQQILVIPSIILSLYFSIKQYQKITYASDDLCWNGENWLMHKSDGVKSAIFLDIKPDCWISGQLSLLHFCCEDSVADISTSKSRDYYWLFSRSILGERMYSQLIYLVKQSFKNQLKQEQG